MIIKKLLFLISLGCLVSINTSCISNKTASDWMKFYRSDRYKQVIQPGNHKITLQYVAPQLSALIQSQIDSSTVLSKTQLDSLVTSIKMHDLSFYLTLSPKVDTGGWDLKKDVIYGGLSGEATYQETLNKYLFGLKENIWVEWNGVKYPLLQYHMVNTWGITPSRSFVLSFRELFPINEKNTIFLVLDNLVPGQGRDKIKFEFPL